MMSNTYKNQDKIDELQQKVFEISPELKFYEFSVSGDVAVKTFLRIPEKGNKTIIESLIALGFRKLYREKAKTNDYWSMSTTYSMVVVLEKSLDRGGIANKGTYIESLTEEQFNAGLIKFNIPGDDRLNSLNGEGVWGWVTQEDKEKYHDDGFAGKITAILLNQPIEYFGRLVWGSEVVLQCHGRNRPTLDPEWVKLYLWEE